MFYFTTFFDKNYLSRGLVLYNSLKANCGDFQFYVLCLDTFTLDYFRSKQADYPNVVCLSLEELERADEDLIACKQGRNTIEYYFTLSPCLPLFVLKKYNTPHICSLDADIMFFSSPARIFKLLDSYSVLVTPHYFSKALLEEDRIKYGRNNVSFQVFKNNPTGLACLEKWRTDCIDWCYDYYEEGVQNRYADQKYLDKWPELFLGQVYESNINGAGVAVWNIDNYKFSRRDGQLMANDEPLVFYHYHNFKIINDKIAHNSFDAYKVKNRSGLLINSIYKDYWYKLEAANSELKITGDHSKRTNLDMPLRKLTIGHGIFFYTQFNRIYTINLVWLRNLIHLKNKLYGRADKS